MSSSHSNGSNSGQSSSMIDKSLSVHASVFVPTTLTAPTIVPIRRKSRGKQSSSGSSCCSHSNSDSRADRRFLGSSNKGPPPLDSSSRSISSFNTTCATTVSSPTPPTTSSTPPTNISPSTIIGHETVQHSSLNQETDISAISPTLTPMDNADISTTADNTDATDTIQIRKKKTKKDRTAPRKRRHQRGKSDVDQYYRSSTIGSNSSLDGRDRGRERDREWEKCSGQPWGNGDGVGYDNDYRELYDEQVKLMTSLTHSQRGERERRSRRQFDGSTTIAASETGVVSSLSQHTHHSSHQLSTHHKSKSDGDISLWFDEIKQRRVTRLREGNYFPGGSGVSSGSNGSSGLGGGEGMSLVFSQPEEWVFGHDLMGISGIGFVGSGEHHQQKGQQCVDTSGVASTLESGSSGSVSNGDQYQYRLEDAEYVAEEMERKRWQHWAQCAAELERKRRIQVLQELDAEQEIERQVRRRWAIKAIEQEKSERISAQFLSTLSSTNWFNETITAYHEDYELVCPYYKLGCRVSCRRGNIEKHLKKCRFALELVEQALPEVPGGYEVVCPNSTLGCTYIGNLDALQKHLTECSHAGQTAQQEIDERHLLKQDVIRQQEEERARRVRFDENVIVKRPVSLSQTDRGGVEVSVEKLHSGYEESSAQVDSLGKCNSISGAGSRGRSEYQLDSDASDAEGGGAMDGRDRYRHSGNPTHLHHNSMDSVSMDVDSTSENSDGGGGRPRTLSRRKALLQSLLEEQTKSVIASLHREATLHYAAIKERINVRFDAQEQTIGILRSAIHGLWSFADIMPFGSHATGLSCSSSDIDLVVCFCDQYKTLPSITGVVPLLQNLAECIQREASDVFVIRKVLLHSAVPIIKADVLKSGLVARGILPGDRGVGAGGSSSSTSSHEDGVSSGGSSHLPSASVPEISYRTSHNVIANTTNTTHAPHNTSITGVTSSIDNCKVNATTDLDDIYLSVDISINGPSHSGLATTEFVRSMLCAHPILRPAVCVLKEFFKAKGLSDPYTGGLSSYGVFLLVLLLFQRHNRLLFSPPSTTVATAATATTTSVTASTTVSPNRTFHSSSTSTATSSGSSGKISSISRSFSFGNDDNETNSGNISSSSNSSGGCSMRRRCLSTPNAETTSHFHMNTTTTDATTTNTTAGTTMSTVQSSMSSIHPASQPLPSPLPLLQSPPREKSLSPEKDKEQGTFKQRRPQQLRMSFSGSSSSGGSSSGFADVSVPRQPHSTSSANVPMTSFFGSVTTNTTTADPTPVPSEHGNAGDQSGSGGNTNNSKTRNSRSNNATSASRGRGTSRGGGKAVSNYYQESLTWTKVQQQLDFGCGVADKLLGVKRGSSKRRNSKTALSLSTPYTECDVALPPPTSHAATATPGVDIDGADCSESSSSISSSISGINHNNSDASTENAGDSSGGNSSGSSRNHPLHSTTSIDRSTLCPTHTTVTPTLTPTADNTSGDNTNTALGHLLIDFLEFYGEAWENEKVGFSVRDGGFKFDLENSVGTPSHPQADDPFVLEDPINVMNNVAKSCYNVAGLKSCIQAAYSSYRACVVKPTSGSRGSSISPRRERDTGGSNSTSGTGTNTSSSSPTCNDSNVSMNSQHQQQRLTGGGRAEGGGTVDSECRNNCRNKSASSEMSSYSVATSTTTTSISVNYDTSAVNSPTALVIDIPPLAPAADADVEREIVTAASSCGLVGKGGDSSAGEAHKDRGQEIVTGSVRVNIKTRATNYMRQYNRGQTNSPVNPTRKLDPVQSIVSEVRCVG